MTSAPMDSTETTLAASVLAHLIFVHKWQPNYAKRAAEHYAKLNPHELADMPEKLQKALLQAANPSK